MNKIFKVIWSKSKQCYIVVSEMAKNHSGKKKIVVASILAAMAVGADSLTAVSAVPEGPTSADSVALGKDTSSYGGNDRYNPSDKNISSVSIGNTARTNGAGSIAIGSNAQSGYRVNGLSPQDINYGVAIGRTAVATGDYGIGVGYNTRAALHGIAMGEQARSLKEGATTLGVSSRGYGKGAIAIGWQSLAGADVYTVGVPGSNINKDSSSEIDGYNNWGDMSVGLRAMATGGNATALGRNAAATAANAVAIGGGNGKSYDDNTERTLASGEKAAAIGYNSSASGKSASALGTKASASAENAAAIGTSASASAKDTLAAGSSAAATAEGATAVGKAAKAQKADTTALGSGATASEINATALGKGATASKGDATAVGSGAKATEANAIAIGKGSEASKGNAIAIGKEAEAAEASATAVGDGASAEKANAIAIGTGATSSGGASGVAIGKGAQSKAEEATAIGADSKAEKAHDSALGTSATASGGGSTAVGYLVNATGNQSFSAGSNTAASGEASVGIGYKASATGNRAISIGGNNGNNVNQATGANSTAIGTGAQSTADNATALGKGAIAKASDAMAFGTDAVAGNANATALGNGANAISTSGIAIGEGATVGVAAAGRTPAVDAANSIAIGKNAKVLAGSGSIALGADTQITSADVATSSGAGQKTYPYMLTNTTGTDAVSDKEYGIVAIGTKRSSTDTGFARRLTGVAGGVNDYDAVNLKQVKALESNERHIKAKTGNDAYRPDATGKITLNYVNGKGANVTGETAEITDVAKKSVVDGINTTVNTHTTQISNLTSEVGGKVSQSDFNTFKAKAITFTGDDNAGVARTLDTTLTVKGGANYTSNTVNTNIRVEKDGTTGAAGLLVKLSDKLTGMKEIAGDGKTDLVIKNGTNTVTITPGKDNDKGTVNFGDAKVVASNLEADITYRANGVADTAANTVKLKKGLNFTAATDTNTTTDGPKSGLSITTGADGLVTFGLDKATRSKVDNAADKNLSNLSDDGKDKVKELAKTAAKDAVKVAPGINTTVTTDTTTTPGVTTYKVNANDTTVAVSGTELTIDGGVPDTTTKIRAYTLGLSTATKGKLAAVGNLATVIGGTTIAADGTVTGPTFNITKADGGTDTANTLKDAIDKLNATNAGQNTKISETAGKVATLETNVTNLGNTVTNLGNTVTNLGNTVTNLGNTVSNNYNDLSSKITQAGTNVASTLTAKGLDFTGNDTTETGKVHRDLGTTLTIQGAKNFTRGATETNNIKVEKNNDALDVKLAENLGNIKEIAGDGTHDLVIKNGDTKVTVKAPKDGDKGSIDFGDTKLVTNNLDANISYKAGTETDKKTVKLQTGLNFVAGTGTVAPTTPATGAATTTSPTTSTDDKAAKKGIVISTEADGVVNIGLDSDTRSAIDNAASKNYVATELSNLSNTITNNANLNFAGNVTKDAQDHDADKVGLPLATGTLHIKGDATDITTTAKGDTVEIALTKTLQDKLKQLGDTSADGRDGKSATSTPGTSGTGTADTPGASGTPGTTPPASAGSTGLTGADGLNGHTLTDKVNALRNGEAGSVVFTDDKGERLVKGNDGKYYHPTDLKPDGTPKTAAENNGTAPKPVDNPQARVVNSNGDTKTPTTLSNIADGKVEAGSHDAVNGGQLHTVKTDLTNAGLDFYGNKDSADTDKVHRNLGQALKLKGTGNFTRAATATNNIDVVKNAAGDGFGIQLAENLVNITEISGDGSKDLVIKNGDTKVTVKAPKDGDKGSIDFGDTKLVTNNLDANISYKAGTETDKKTVKLQTGLNFVAGTGTVAPTTPATGAATTTSPTTSTDDKAAKKGIVISTEADGVVNIGLDSDTRSAIDNAASKNYVATELSNLSNTITNNANLNFAGNVTKDAQDHDADKVGLPLATGTLHIKGDATDITTTAKGDTVTITLTSAAQGKLAAVGNLATVIGGTTITADGTVTGPTFNITNATGGTDSATTLKDAIDKLNATNAGQNTKISETAGKVGTLETNVTNLGNTVTNLGNTVTNLGNTVTSNYNDLSNKITQAGTNVASTLTSKGLDFTGNDTTAKVHRDLGTALTIQGAENFTRAAAETNNIKVVKNNDTLDVKLAENLGNIKEIAGDGTHDLVIKNGDTKVTVKAPKDGDKGSIDFGDTKLVTNNLDANISYKAGTETDKKTVKLQTGLNFVAGTGTVAPTTPATGAATTTSPTTSTDDKAAKKGIVISTEADGVVNIGLDSDTRSAIDNAASKNYVATELSNLSNTITNNANLNFAGNVTKDAQDHDADKVGLPLATGTLHIKGDATDITTTAKGDTVEIALTKTLQDKLKQLGDTSADGRDGKSATSTPGTSGTGTADTPGASGTPGTTPPASAGSTGLTGADGLNGHTLTDKVNALRNGEAGSVVFTDDKGERLVKGNDGKYYHPTDLKPDGTPKTAAENNGTAPKPVDNPQARVVNSNGDTKTPTTLSNIADGKVEAGSHDAVNGGQLHTVKTDLTNAGLDFYGNKDSADTDKVHRNLGQALKLKGTGNFTRAATATNNIDVVKNAAGDGFGIQLAENLVNITEISGDGSKDLVIKNGDTKVTVKAPKDGDKGSIDFGDTKLVTNNLDADITYRANGVADTAAHKVKLQKGLNFVAGDGTVAPTAPAAGTVTTPAAGTTTSPTASTDGKAAKKGIVISTEDNGVVNIGLDSDTRSAIDNAASKSEVNTAITNLSTTITNNSNLRYAGDTNVGAATGEDHLSLALATDTLKVAGTTGEVKTVAQAGTITISLEQAVKDKLAQLSDKNADGRDGKLGSEANAIASTGIATADGLNGATATYKVNALRHGEAGTVVYTDQAGNRIVKATDGKYYKATEVNADGVVKTPAENNGVAPVEVLDADIVATLVNKDGTTAPAATDADKVATTKLTNIKEAAITATSNDAVTGRQLYGLKSDLATYLGGDSKVNADGTFTGPTYNITKDDGSNTTEGAKNVGAAISKLDTRINNANSTLSTKGLDFYGNKDGADTDKVHRNLGEALKVKGADNFTRTGTNNIDIVKNTAGDGLDIKLAENLGNMKGISGNGTDSLVIKNGDATITLTPAKPAVTDPTSGNVTKPAELATVNFGDSNVVVKNLDADITYRANNDTDANAKSVKLKKGLNFVAGTGTVAQPAASTTPATGGTTTPATPPATDSETTKSGIVITADTDGKVTIGLDTTTRSAIDNAANKDLSNLSQTGKDQVTALAKAAAKDVVKVEAGKNTTVTPKQDGDVTKYVVDAYDTKVAVSGTELTINGGDPDANNVRTYTLGLSDDVKNKLTAVTNVGNTASDGRDGKAANGKDGAAGNAGDKGLTGKDGLNGSTLTDKVNALRNGEAGSVVYTNEAGERLIKANDGNYYKPSEVNTDGSVKTQAENNNVPPTPVANPQARIVNGSGDTTTPTTLSNIADGKIADGSHDAVNGGQLNTVKTDLTKAGLDFTGDDTTDKVHRDLGTTLTIKGGANFTRGTTDNNIKVVKNNDALDVKLAENLVNMKEISGDGKTDLVIKNGDATITLTPAKPAVTDPTAGTTTPAKTATVDFGDSNVVVKNLDADITYRANNAKDTDAKTVKLKKGLNFVSATDAITTTDGPKSGLTITTGDDGLVTFGLDKDTRKAIDNAANQDLSNLTTAGKKVITDAAQGAVKVKAGNNVTIDPETEDNVTTYTVNGRDTTVQAAAGGSVSVTGGTLSGAGERAYTVDLTEATKTQINRIDGIDTRLGTAEGNITTLQQAVQGGRVFAADTGVASAKVALGGTLAIKGGAKDILKADNIGVELTDVKTENGVTTPATMMIRLAKNVDMKDGSTSYDYYKDIKGTSVKVVTTKVDGSGVTITPEKVLDKLPVTLTVDGLDNGGNPIHNVGAGTKPNDAATVGQVNAVAGAVSQRVNNIGAHAAALAAMNPLSYDPLKKSQVMAGYGAYKGSNALALGVAHYANEDTLFNVGVSVGNGENMVNAGVTYRFGGEDSMIPERYKGGPISSVYVMQDEITALKAENARKDVENAKKEAENEEMKAQIKMLIERVTMLEAKK